MATLGDARRLTTVLDSTSRGWAVVFGGDVARMLLSFAAGVLIARALGPDQFGVYVVLGAASAIAAVLVDLGLSQAAVVRVAGVWETDQAVGRRRGQVFVWIRWLAALALTLPAVAVAGWLARVIGLPESAGGYSGSALLAIALLGVVAAALGGAVSTLFQATRRFGAIAGLLITNAGLTLVLAVLLAAAGRLDLLAVLLVLGIVPSLITFGVGRRVLGRGWSLRPPSCGAMENEAPRLLRIGGWLWLAGLLAVVAGKLDLLLVNRMSAPATVGAYGLAFSLSASLGAMSGSLYTVLLPAASGLRGGAEVRGYLRRGLVRSSVLSLMLVPLLVLARPFITAVYGADYAPAVWLFQLFLPVAALELLVMPVMLLVIPLDLPQWLAAAGVVRVAVVAGLSWMLLPIWGPPGAIAARAVAVVLGAAVAAAVVARAGSRRWAAVARIDPGEPATERHSDLRRTDRGARGE